MKIEENYSLLRHNTFGLNAKTRWFVEYENEEDLKKILSDEYFFSQAFWHIGQGSNLLFLGDFNGVIIHSAITGIEVVREDEEFVWVKAGAGLDWDSFVDHCVKKGWGGIENLSLIPGEVGAAAIQNIGAYGVEACETITEVLAYSVETGEQLSFSNADCEYAYRYSFFKDPANKGKHFVTQVIFRLSKNPVYKTEYGNLKESLEGQPINLQTVRDAVIAVRQAKLPDPKIMGNAGSFFMNPYVCMEHFESLKKQYPTMPSFPVDGKVMKIPAAWLIDQCGLKGMTLGGAAIHTKQPLVLINQNGASGDEIALLAEKVREAVKGKFGIELHPEVNYI